MTIKDLISVIDKNVIINVVTEHIHWLYKDKADNVPRSLINMKIKVLDVIKDEFFIVLED